MALTGSEMESETVKCQKSPSLQHVLCTPYLKSGLIFLSGNFWINSTPNPGLGWNLACVEITRCEEGLLLLQITEARRWLPKGGGCKMWLTVIR